MTNSQSASLVSVVQAGTVLFDNRATLAKFADLAADARAAGARLALFPEAFVGGYPKGRQFGLSLGRRTEPGRDEFRRYFESAIEVPGPETGQIAAVARDNSLVLVVGVVERSGGTLYCTVLYFGADGSLLGKRRKLMPTALERAVWGCGDGSTLRAIDTPVGRVSAVICWENYLPLLRMALYSQNVEIYCAPTVDDRDMWIPTMRHIAYEGRTFVLSACQYLEGESAAEPLIRGGSCIISPFGEILAGPAYGAEQVLTAEIDLGEIARGKFDLDVTGHYARPDLFQLRVNDTPQRTVQSLPQERFEAD